MPEADVMDARSDEEHLAYEVRQLRWDLEKLYSVWNAMHGATPTRLLEGTAYFEAALVHARNLIEFLIHSDSPHQDALTPGDFGLGHYDHAAAAKRFEDEVGLSPDQVYSDICTYVSHLSRARSLGVPYWELQPIEAGLLALVEAFIDAVESQGRALSLVRDALTEPPPDW